MPPVVRLLVAANVGAFLFEQLAAVDMAAALALWPAGSYRVSGFEGRVGFAPWQLATYAFLHANLAHLALNMFGLWTFGRDIERALGSRRFAALYAASVLVAGLAQLAVVSVPPVTQPFPTVGASGGVFGVLLAFAVLYPRRTVMLVIPPIPMPAWLFVTGYAALELFWGVTGTVAGIAHFAHLGGMVGAWLVLRRWRR
jgi:membrane associated rhomboid family serine protease